MTRQNEMSPASLAVDVAAASWTAPVLWRFWRRSRATGFSKSGRGLPHSKTLRRNLTTSVAVFILALGFSVSAALTGDWQHAQQFDAPAPGLVKFALPADTLDAARPALEDLRLYDAAGNEQPFVIERPVPVSKAVQHVKSFTVSLQPKATVITLETGLLLPLDGVSLESPAADFIKAVRVEGSADGLNWKQLADGLPVFRQANGASQLRVAIPAGAWPWLRLTVDDQRSRPVPFTSARVHGAFGESAPGEAVSAAIVERHENPGETRLTLNLGAANLDVVSVMIETPEPLFTRPVALAVAEVSESAVREQTLGQGTIFRFAIEGQPTVANLSVPLERQVRSRELLLLIRNHDSPPLPVTAVRVERRPVYLVFMARAAGAHHLLTGNSHCDAAHYDLASFGANLKGVPVSPVKVSPLAGNPGYRAPEVLAGISQDGAALDVGAWKFRKPVKLTRAGAQQLELDLDVLAHAQPGFTDLRLLRGGRQVPYILERTSIVRTVAADVTAATDAKEPKLSRWIIKLPNRNLPVTRLTCASRTPLFQREVALFEELSDERGDKYRRHTGSASWVQTPDRKSREFDMMLSAPLEGDTLILETRNGDNPPIELEKFQFHYLATRALFKAGPEDAILAYYGNRNVTPPSYDLSLVAGQLLTADKSSATLAAEEQLKKSSWTEGRTPGTGGVLFWGILALVVVGLLVVISRLLPKTSPPAS